MSAILSTEKIPAAIPGLDIAMGLRRVMGKKSLYISMLRRFVAGQRDAASDMRLSLREGDLEKVQRLAHNVKSISGVIGAAQLQDHAAELERAIRQRRSLDTIDTSLAVFETSLAEMIAAIERSLPPEQTPLLGDVTQEELASIVEQLAALLADNNATALELFTKHAQAIQNSLRDDFPSLQSAINSFDFDTAASLLERARKRAAV
jgi:HPt (histidine-containing phosphotransfer) domain-containing protein